MPFGPELFDPTTMLDPPVYRDVASSDSLPTVPGTTNVARFERAFQSILLPGYLSWGVVATAPGNAWTGTVQGKILYLPEGRYLVENTLPQQPAWRGNLWDRYLAGEVFPENLASQRAANPFAASLKFPAEITLWLGPGAVLVPAEGAIVHIASALICERGPAFDLRFGGLVVFGERTPKLCPEWWMVPGVSHAEALQHTLDAAIHHRENVWELPLPFPSPDQGPGPRQYGTNKVKLPPVPIELQGQYDLQRTVEVRGGATNTRLLHMIGPKGVRRGPGRAEFPGQLVPETAPGDAPTRPVVDDPSRERRQISAETSAIIAGVWGGRARPGARLIAVAPFDGPSVVKCVYAAGLTIRNVAITMKPELRGVRGLDLRPLPVLGAQSILGMAVQRCAFEATDTTLVQIGDPIELAFPAEPSLNLPPIAFPSNNGTDMSGLVFDQCEFRPHGRGTAVAVRSHNSVPFRFHGCNFEGEADAMIDAWKCTFLLDRCTFENAQRREPTAGSVPGFEEPEGVDLYLRNEPPRVGRDPSVRPLNLRDAANGDLPAFTAVGCISRSRTFLATPTAWPDNTQYTTWPVVLLDVRHVPATTSLASESIRWFLRPGRIPLVQPLGDLPDARLGAVPLVVVGGQFAGVLTTSDGAAPCAVVGACGVNGAPMPLHRWGRPDGVTGYFEAFVLKVDQGMP